MDCYSWIRTCIRSSSDLHFCQASHPEGVFIGCCISWFTSFRPNPEFLEQGFYWLSGRFLVNIDTVSWALQCSFRELQKKTSIWLNLQIICPPLKYSSGCRTVCQLLKTNSVHCFCQGETSTGYMWTCKVSMGGDDKAACTELNQTETPGLPLSSCGQQHLLRFRNGMHKTSS